MTYLSCDNLSEAMNALNINSTVTTLHVDVSETQGQSQIGDEGALALG